MKPVRVTLSASVVAVVLFVLCFIPMPVTRIRQHGYVEVQPNEIAQVSVEVPADLRVMYVAEGQFVKKGKILAEFASPELESRRDQSSSQMKIKEEAVRALNELMSKELDLEQKARLREQRDRADAEYRQAEVSWRHIKLEMDKLVLRAPRDGVVIGLPTIDDVGKRWDREQNTVFCSIGDKSKLRILVPLSPADYDLLKENMKKSTARDPLQTTIRVQGHSSQLWTGRISHMPNAAADKIPVQLSTKGGGPIAVKPTSEANKLVPQTQVFLVGIDFDQPDDTIAINSAAQVKIHCEYRSCAWWAYRTVCSAFDMPLMW